MKRSIAVRLFTSLGIGALGAILVCTLAIMSTFFFNALVVIPVRILDPILGPLIPSSAMYRLFPNGGAIAVVFLVLASSLLFWTLVLGITHFAWRSIRRSKLIAES